MVEELKPGGFSDGTVISEKDIAELLEKGREADEKKQTLIAAAKDQGTITDQYAALLAAIKTSTTAPEQANLIKVEIALSFEKILREGGFSNQPVAYIGAGYDWHFPVALGARRIEMIDLDYYDESKVEKMMDSVRVFDPAAQVTHESGLPVLSFSVNLSGRPEQVVLSMRSANIEDYVPSQALGGVIESCGPSKGFLDQTSPVMPRVAEKLTQNAFIVNSDFHGLETVAGCERIQRGDYAILKVTDRTALTDLARTSEAQAKIPSPTNPNLSHIRAAATRARG